MTHLLPVLILNTTLQNSTGLLYCTNDVMREIGALMQRSQGTYVSYDVSVLIVS